jgi:hypothetical protein
MKCSEGLRMCRCLFLSTPNLCNGLEFFSYFFQNYASDLYVLYNVFALSKGIIFFNFVQFSSGPESTVSHYKCTRIFSNNCEELTHKSSTPNLPNSKNECQVIPEEEVHKMVMLHLAWSAVKFFVNVIMTNKWQHGIANYMQMVLAFFVFHMYFTIGL